MREQNGLITILCMQSQHQLKKTPTNCGSLRLLHPFGKWVYALQHRLSRYRHGIVTFALSPRCAASRGVLNNGPAHTTVCASELLCRFAGSIIPIAEFRYLASIFSCHEHFLLCIGIVARLNGIALHHGGLGAHVVSGTTATAAK
jgi:hypothetical protein